MIRFAGDSGDGMQLTGDRFTSASALWGNDLSTLPDFPAEIRAPAGTLAGVSAFQVHISDHDITTPGDAPDILVAMNPAALRAELEGSRLELVVLPHRSELEHLELAPVAPDSALTEEDRAAERQGDAGSGHDQKRRREQDQHRGKRGGSAAPHDADPREIGERAA